MLTLGNFFLQGEGEVPSAGSVHAQATVHGVEDWPEQALLEIVDLAEAHLVDGGLLGGVDLESDYSIFAVVRPQLILAGFGVPLLAFVFPVQVVLAVHGG